MKKTSVRIVCVALSCAGIVALGACNRDQRRSGAGESGQVGEKEEGVGTTRTTGAPVGLAAKDAVQKITAARCEHEAKCGNVGADKDYATTDACAQKLSRDLAPDLNASECAGGIDQKELDECVMEIRSEDCNNPIDTIGRIAACRTSDLCHSTPRR